MKIASLIITYNPDEKKIKEVIESLITQVELILFVDNNSNNRKQLKQLECEKISFIYLDDNYGIAKATNIGFDYLKHKHFNYCLLSDQDTVYSKDYVDILIKNLDDKSNNKIIAYAPNIYDNISNINKHVYKLENNKIIKCFPTQKTEIFQTIASGLFINLNNLDSKLIMNEDLFIDYVDFEWCWKVIYYGFRILYIPELRINHTLGDKKRKLFGINVSVRSSIRYYYIIRNTIYLSRNTKYLTTRSKRQLFKQSIKYFCGYILISEQKILLIKGFFDGLFSKMGKYVEKK